MVMIQLQNYVVILKVNKKEDAKFCATKTTKKREVKYIRKSYYGEK